MNRMMQDPNSNWKHAVEKENEARDMPRHEAILHMENAGVAVVVRKRDFDGSHIRFPAVTVSVAAYEVYGPSVLSPGVCVRYFHTFEFEIVSMDVISPFKGFDWRKLVKKNSTMIKVAMKRAVFYDDLGIMPTGWLRRSIYGNPANASSAKSLVPGTIVTLYGNNDSSDSDESDESEEYSEVSTSYSNT